MVKLMVRLEGALLQPAGVSETVRVVRLASVLPQPSMMWTIWPPVVNHAVALVSLAA